MSTSNQDVYTKNLYLTEMSISNRNVHRKTLFLTEKSIRKVYI